MPLSATALAALALILGGPPAAAENGPGSVIAAENPGADVTARADEVDEARAAVQAAALTAADALERYTLAVRSLQAAHEAETLRQVELEQAQAVLVRHRRELGRWARTAYQDGSRRDGLTSTLLTARSTDELGTTITWLRRVGDSRGRLVEAVEEAESTRRRAAGRASTATALAARAAIDASQARSTAESAVAKQRELLGRAESGLAKAQDAAAAAKERELLLAGAALQNSGAGNAVTGAVGSCAGGAVQNYPNGKIPLAALCPLWGAPRHYLRADAAHAFDQLNRAYAARFGRPICVTDSYRSFAGQVRLYAAKPTLAAVPGTSNHGWGTATDLCGGIQRFGSAEHRWMQTAAPLRGWFHPAWARINGSRPEPWHWEYAG